MKWVLQRLDNRVQQTDLRCWSKKDLLELVRWLLANVYSVNGGEVWRQVIGIPMGTNFAPALANLYLAGYECHTSVCSLTDLRQQMLSKHGCSIRRFV